MSIIPYDPATILEIKVGDLSAPVAVGVELSKLYLSSDAIVQELIKDVKRDEETNRLIVPPDLLPWYKEQRMLLDEIHKLTGEVEEKVHLKRMEMSAEVYKSLIKDLPDDKKIELLQALKSGKSFESIVSR